MIVTFVSINMKNGSLGCLLVVFLLEIVRGDILSNLLLEHNVLIRPSDPAIRYSGRINKTNDSWYKFDWSGIEISFTLTGDSFSIVMQDYGNWYNVFVDGNLFTIFNTTQNQHSYGITLLDNSQHEILITKRTEASFGIVAFGGILHTNTSTLLMRESSKNSRRIEFAGGSMTCGYGDEGTSPNCPFSADTENNYKAYGKVVSKMLNADYQAVAWSGKGVVRNYGEPNITSEFPFPSYYVHTLGNQFDTEEDLWDFSLWVPSIVGTNDFSTQPNPPQDVFEQGYINWIQQILDSYQPYNPDIKILVTCGPMIGDPCCSYTQNVVDYFGEDLGVYYLGLDGILTYPDDYGCAGHPNVEGHQKMADVVAPVVQKIMEWL